VNFGELRTGADDPRMAAGRELINRLRAGVIVSCQTSQQNPLHGPVFAAALAVAAEMGGARGVRADGPAYVAAISGRIAVPLMGINTIERAGSPVRITPTFADAQAVVWAGAQIVSVDGTTRTRPDGVSLAELMDRIHRELGVPIQADVATMEDAIAARAAGADLVGSSITGYDGPQAAAEPDIDLVRALVRELDCPVIAERHFSTPEQIRAAFDVGAHAVIVGSAITDVAAITRRLVAASCPGVPRP